MPDVQEAAEQATFWVSFGQAAGLGTIVLQYIGDVLHAGRMRAEYVVYLLQWV
mgnify:CR=1 FL=1